MASKNRLFAKFANAANADGQITTLPDDISSGGLTVYSTAADLPLSGNTGGDQAFITDTNRLVIWDDAKNLWFNVALLNLTPSINSIQDSDGLSSPFLLSQNGVATTITITATDPDGDPLTYSATGDSDFAGLGTISQDGNKFTITPLSQDSASTESGIITFSATDNINVDTAVSTFNLYFWIYDLTGRTVSYDQKVLLSPADGNGSLYIRSDGLKLYNKNINGPDLIYQFSLSTAWDMSTITYDNKSIDVRDVGGDPKAFFFKPDGSALYVAGTTGTIGEYGLSTPWDVSSGYRPADRYGSTGHGVTPTGFFFKPDGRRVYLSYTDDDIYQFDLSTAWDISTLSGSPTIIDFGVLSGTGGEPEAIFFSPDGSKFWCTHQTTGENLFQFSMSTAWDISTASYDNIAIDLYNLGQDAGAGAYSLQESIWFGGNKFFTMTSDENIRVWNIT